jgi:hypothetical protein
MPVLSEEKLLGYLSQTLELSRDLLARIPRAGTKTVSEEFENRFLELVNSLRKEREQDAHLRDEAWNWILEGKSEYNHIQMYGRLAWINLQLLELL